MTDTAPSQSDIAALAAYDTPTICNALELTSPDRRATGFTVFPFTVADPSLPPMVGHVRTARIRAMTPPEGSPAEARALRERHYENVAAAPGPTVVVIEDVDPIPGYGAFWGEVNSAIHKGLGCLGCVTNGSFRDLAELAPGFQILGGMVGPSHAWVHVVDVGGEVTVNGMAARNGDLIHADRHGAVIIPQSAVAKLPAAVELVQRREAPILAAARAEGFDISALRRALGDAAEIH
jgi:regulator of RNase E activity RraA